MHFPFFGLKVPGQLASRSELQDTRQIRLQEICRRGMRERLEETQRPVWCRPKTKYLGAQSSKKELMPKRRVPVS